MSEIANSDNTCPHCKKGTKAAVPTHHLLAGTVLGGKFLIGSALGEGGFGITYIGRDLNLDIKVAVKEYYPNGYVNRSNTTSLDVTCSMSDGKKDFFLKGRDRFLNEARILAKFSSESGVVSVRDFFEANNTAYIVMEYLDGMDLKEYVRRNGLLSATDAVELVRPVMKALKKIHAGGLIHRDISPDNIRLVSGGAKLLDFGAARDVSDAQHKSLSVMLKPGYAPEEQYRSRGNQGPWTDVYALSATIYKCITGITPDDSTQRLYNDDMKLPSQLGAKISPAMESVLMKGMAVRAQHRYQSIDELMTALEQAKNAPQGVANTHADKTQTLGIDYTSRSYPDPITNAEQGPQRSPITGNGYTASQANTGNAYTGSHVNNTGVQYQSYNRAADAEKNSKPKKSKKALPIILVCLCLILIGGGIACWMLFFSSDSEDENKSYEDVLYDYELAITMDDAKNIIANTPFNFSYDKYVEEYSKYIAQKWTYIDEYGTEYDAKEIEAYINETLDQLKKDSSSDFEYQYGSDWEITIDITDTEEITGTEMEDLLAEYNGIISEKQYEAAQYSESYANLYYQSMLDSSKVEKMILVSSEGTVHGSNEIDTDTIEEYMVLINSNWYVLDPYALNMLEATIEE